MSDSPSDLDDYEMRLAGHEGMLDMLNLISQLQSDRMNNQRAELRPLQPEDPSGASLPGQQAANTIGLKPEEDFLEIIARVQGSRLEDQRTELPRPQNQPTARAAPEQSVVAPTSTPAKAPAEPSAQASAPASIQATPQARAERARPQAGAQDADDDAFFAQLMRAQSSRLEDQRATIGGSRKKN